MKRIIAVCLAGILLVGCGLRSEPKQEQKKQVKPQQEIDFLQLGISLIKKGEIGPAVQALDQAVKNDPGNIQPYILLGQTYMHLNEFDRAIDSFLAALRVAPDQGEIYYMLAIANGLRGRKDLALSNAEKALLLFQKDKDGENFKRALVLFQGLSQE